MVKMARYLSPRRRPRQLDHTITRRYGAETGTFFLCGDNNNNYNNNKQWWSFLFCPSSRSDMFSVFPRRYPWPNDQPPNNALQGPNIWPDSDSLGEGWRDSMSALFRCELMTLEFSKYF